MRSILVVSTPATDPGLLTVEELRLAAGVTGGARDAELISLGLQVSAAITSECCVAIGSGGVPTLRRESLSETFFRTCRQQLFLARRHDIEISSVEINGTALTDADFHADPESGELLRLVGGLPCHWSGTKIVIEYEAGFSDVPDDLKKAALDFFRMEWLNLTRDPSVKSIETDVPDVMRKKLDYWVGAIPGQSSDGGIPDSVSGQLDRFRNTWIA